MLTVEVNGGGGPECGGRKPIFGHLSYKIKSKHIHEHCFIDGSYWPEVMGNRTGYWFTDSWRTHFFFGGWGGFYLAVFFFLILFLISVVYSIFQPPKLTADFFCSYFRPFPLFFQLWFIFVCLLFLLFSANITSFRSGFFSHCFSRFFYTPT